MTFSPGDFVQAPGTPGLFWGVYNKARRRATTKSVSQASAAAGDSGQAIESREKPLRPCPGASHIRNALSASLSSGSQPLLNVEEAAAGRANLIMQAANETGKEREQR